MTHSHSSPQDLRLPDLVDMSSPHNILTEIRFILTSVAPEFDFKPLTNIFFDMIRLFRGEYPGYRAMTSEYHDIMHTTNIFIALARLMHGYALAEGPLPNRVMLLGLTTALLHDTGYIQTAGDTEGTGAKYTLERITRGISFMETYLKRQDFTRPDIEFCTRCLPFASLESGLMENAGLSGDERLAGKMLGTADLLSQMADRAYLEKLLFLFYEFKEGRVLGFESELDLLRKTAGFYERTQARLADEFDDLARYLPVHFKNRWGAERNLYVEAIEKNIDYLQYLLANHEQDYRNYLRRGDVLNKLYARRQQA